MQVTGHFRSDRGTGMMRSAEILLVRHDGDVYGPPGSGGRPGKPSGLLERWDARDQRIVEKQIREGQRREKEWRETYFEVVAPDGRVLKVRAQPSGYPFRFEGTGDWPDIILMPFYLLVPWLLNRYWHRGGWSVAVLAPRRWMEKRLLLERFDSEQAAKTRAAELAASLGEPR